MTDFNARNERVKRAYVRFLKEADRKAESTVRGIEKALLRYETATGFADFAAFNSDRAVGFKKALTELDLGQATILSTVNAVKAFFKWLACQQGYKSKVSLPDIEYLNLSEKEVRAAREPRYRDFPTLEQVRRVVSVMPAETEIERRDRALLAFTIVTGMRDSAIRSLRLKHIDLDRKLVKQDPREVATKFSKRIDTFFFPVGEMFEDVVADWVTYLREERLFGNDDPVFPRTALGHDADQAFVATGVEPVCWATTSPIRGIFRAAFEGAGLTYLSPHSFRYTLVQFGEQHCRTAEEFKAWSQNLGHEQVLTTFNSYGKVSTHRQGELVRSVRGCKSGEAAMEALIALVADHVEKRTSSSSKG